MSRKSNASPGERRRARLIMGSIASCALLALMVAMTAGAFDENTSDDQSTTYFCPMGTLVHVLDVQPPHQISHNNPAMGKVLSAAPHVTIRVANLNNIESKVLAHSNHPQNCRTDLHQFMNENKPVCLLRDLSHAHQLVVFFPPEEL